MIEIASLTKTYKAVQALRGIDLEIPSGMFGLLGPNGAGKSTMLKSLLGFVKPDQGRMTVLDMDVAQAPLAIRARIGGGRGPP